MLNCIILMGRLTADPELKETPNGIPVLSFSIAVDRSYGKERQTDFINVVAWRHTAEFISKYFSKGQMIALQGSLQSRRYTDKQGNNRIAYEVVADSVHFTGSKAETSVATGNAPTAQTASPAFEEPAVQGQSFSVGDLDEFEGFEEIGADEGDLPF